MIFGKRRANDKGSALIMVIVAMLFVGIIASIVLTITIGNLQKYNIGAGAAGNFYNAEEVIDELKENLQAKSNEAYKKAYDEWMQKYVINTLQPGITTEILNSRFKKLFVDYLIKDDADGLKNYFVVKWDDGTVTNPGSAYKNLLYNDFESLKDATIITGDDSEKKSFIEIDSNNVVTIRNISISYKDNNSGQVSNITTDLAFDVSIPVLSVGQNIGISPQVADFALVADKQIKNLLDGEPLVMGSIYGGGKDQDAEVGLLFNNGVDITLYSDKVITRGTIKADNANVYITSSKDNSQEGFSSPRRFGTDIWAKNILLDKSVSGKNVVQIKGICNVSDDLTINGNMSEFSLLESDTSAYYGYNTNERQDSGTGDAAETSASIVVNGDGIRLDMSAAHTLWLAGKSYVKAPEQWGAPNGPGTAFQQGESISYRALQSAYLLPGECLIGIGHNPMTVDEYYRSLSLTDAEKAHYNSLPDEASKKTFLINKKPQVDIGKSLENEGLDLEKYLDWDEKFKPAFVKYTVGGTVNNLIYLYLNFRNPDKAAEYFRDYKARYGDLVSARIRSFGSNGELIVNTSSEKFDDETENYYFDSTASDYKIINTGNIIYYYHDDESDEDILKLYKSNIDYLSDEIRYTQKMKSDTFRNYCTSLDPNIEHTYQDLTDNIVNFEKVHNRGNYVEPIYVDSESGTKIQSQFYIGDIPEIPDSLNPQPAYMITATGNVYIDNTQMGVSFDDINYIKGIDFNPGLDAYKNTIRAGIIIAEGDVYIRNSSLFFGMIIAKGNIIIEGSSKVLAAPRDVRELMETNELVNHYFTRDNGGKIDGNATISNLVNIKYDNWKKD